MKALKSILFVGILALSGSVMALPLSGTILFTGTTNALKNGSATLDISVATGADTFSFNNPISVNLASGDFAGLSGSTVTYSDLVPGALPIAPLWTGGGFSYNLTSISSDTFDGISRRIFGLGTISNGTDSTVMEWNFTTQTPGLTPNTFSFSASAVPEPLPLALIGLGLIGMMMVRKGRKA